ncbi:ECF RNA polymerase sigma factor SigW [Zhongshania aliphaticivorans]|uniref:ECF RNA polymerase sigma factor SigW n=1 Tax=Zhongshania aliphaticivorans TaxID=1470434 RepID=A0A5S9Q5A4_9GAMM|nr:sigma-70 family RNA polymerase sigma factor [Zhongshania aliphaticivorans]CAA0094269.1 ECF RNA polymerase sigma factor SigW [Zhongshania aliphaticivorans]CAA0112356.1 ECF RNA polymerase sigma factor SigW [Zhongshania aliphaticivorans]
MQISDVELMRRVADGDQQAFSTLLDRHSKMVLNLVYRIILSRVDAEDICQEVFERLWIQAPKWQDDAKLTTWLYRVANNLALNHSQRFQQRHVHDDGLVEFIVDSAAEPECPLREADSEVREALGDLPENQRAVMAFRFYQDVSVKDIAVIMDLSAKAVESLLSRAKKQLRVKLGGVK